MRRSQTTATAATAGAVTTRAVTCAAAVVFAALSLLAAPCLADTGKATIQAAPTALGSLVRARLSLVRPAPAAQPRRAAVGWGSGERMTYEVSLGGVKGGRAAIGVGRVRSSDGRQVIRVRALGETVPFFSTFRHMSEDQVTTLDLAGLRPISGRADRKMPGKDRLLQTSYGDHVQQTIRWKGRTLKRVLRLAGPHFDPLTALFALRSAELRPGQKIAMTVVNGTSLLAMEIKVAGRERIYLRGEPRSTIRLDGVGRRVFDNGKLVPGKPVRKMSMWLSDDTKRIPLKVTGDTKLGDVEATLSSYHAPKRVLKLRPVLLPKG